ncbi:LPS export ABC transporter permease LptG [Pseudohoeflea coraliihabitans]|uniref:LPS export ABC transporter permease LptG n=1 Tax=Pseudohoeflea coraliihabitans TaxID=2860393 RepID=A0ABS6WRZ5_9HYPH|nr:LPS export ABC transporter permease LptG [Pseudohoeflea sp. DP4N28-3]MBW3098713.1 LPS export ABC transporter permease LptG [Pseudohoeflea sp. DP4N28-3]
MRVFPGTLWRYFFRRYLKMFIGYFLAVMLVIWLVDFNETAGRLSGSPNYHVGIAFYIAALRVPLVAQAAVPFIALLASIATLMQLNRKYELVVVRAAGVSAWQFLAPLLVANLLLGLVAIVVLNPLATRATGIVEETLLENELRSATPRENSGPPWFKQHTDEGDTIIGARIRAGSGTQLGDATFIRFDPEGKPIDRLEAERATLTDGAWVLRNVNRYRAGEPRETLDRFEVATTLEPEFLGESLVPAESISVFDLPGKIAAARSYGVSANSYAMSFHRLLALPALFASMTVIAAMVSLRFVRFGQSMAVILGGILAGFMLYVVSEVIQAFGEAGTLPPVVAAWLPVVVAASLGTTVLLHKEDG